MTSPLPDALPARGEHVYLRKPVEADRVPFLALIEVSRTFLQPWEPRPPEGASPAHRFERLLRQNQKGQSHKHFVFRCEDDVLLGAMNINNVVHGVFQSASLGYWLGAPHVRRGYATEALQLALRLAFEGLGLHRVEANIRPENDASIALVRRAGFRLEGHSRAFLKIAGAWADHERYALLVDEWEPALNAPLRRREGTACPGSGADAHGVERG